MTADNDSNEYEGPKVEVAATSAPLRWHKFKIVGQIGKLGQSEKLTFISLTHQIDFGLKQQYKENEIVDAVIQAISLHSSFRSYVETLHDLSLPKLHKIFRVDYRERSTLELYQQLATIFQQPKETAQKFLLCTLGLQTKVSFSLARNQSAKFIMSRLSKRPS